MRVIDGAAWLGFSVLLQGCGRLSDGWVNEDGETSGGTTQATSTETDSDSTETGSSEDDSSSSSESESESDEETESGGVPDLPAPACGDELCFEVSPFSEGSITDVSLTRFDEDEFLDVFHTGVDGTFLLLGHGDGTFDPPIDLEVPGIGTSIESTWLDSWLGPNPNRQDLVLTTTAPDAVVTWIAVGGGAMGPATFYPAGSNPVASTRASSRLVTANAGDGTLGRYEISATGELTAMSSIAVGSSPRLLAWLVGGGQRPPIGNWQLAVIDDTDMLHLFDTEQELATFQLPNPTATVWVSVFGDTGSGKVLVTAGDELRMYEITDALELQQTAIWPGGPVAFTHFPIPGRGNPWGLAVLLRDAGAIGFASFCNGRSCPLDDLEFSAPAAANPTSFATGRIDGDFEQDFVVGSPTSGLTLMLANP